MGLADLLMGHRDHEEGDRDALTDAQAAGKLREIFAAMSEVNAFERGDILLHKWPDMADTKSAARPLIFIDYLLEAVDMAKGALNGDSGSNNMARVLDCRVGSFAGGDFVVFLADSRQYRPHPDFPRERPH